MDRRVVEQMAQRTGWQGCAQFQLVCQLGERRNCQPRCGSLDLPADRTRMIGHIADHMRPAPSSHGRRVIQGVIGQLVQFARKESRSQTRQRQVGSRRVWGVMPRPRPLSHPKIGAGLIQPVHFSAFSIKTRSKFNRSMIGASENRNRSNPVSA